MLALAAIAPMAANRAMAVRRESEFPGKFADQRL
jgi:hypothetical protein